MWLSMFEITNLDELSTQYRLLEVTNLPKGDSYDKNANRLTTGIAYEIQQPVALVRQKDRHYLALPGDSKLPKLSRPLMPHVVELVPQDGTHDLDFTALNDITGPIAINWLHYAIRGELYRDRRLWGAGRAYYRKRPTRLDPTCDIDLYPGFHWNLVGTGDGRLMVAVDLTARYVDGAWLHERIGRDSAKTADYLYRHCLYQFGRDWFVIQLWGISDRSISKQVFQPPGERDPIDIFSYTRRRWNKNPPKAVRELDPDDPAIIYRYPGSGVERYGALSLCKLTLRTDDPRVSRIHHHSIVSPQSRLDGIAQIVKDHLGSVRLHGVPIRIASQPDQRPRRIFPVPAQRFGDGRVIAVTDHVPDTATDVVSLEDLGRRRLKLVLDPKMRLGGNDPFDAQYMFLPRSTPRDILVDFQTRFEAAMREISGDPNYSVTRVVYDDRGATSLRKQVAAIVAAKDKARITRGYALLVLPDKVKADLHNYIKRELWPHIQFQCATANKIGRHYERSGDRFQVRRKKEGILRSYVRNVALGMMMVNRRWLWRLEEPLHHDIHIGIDVLNGMAGVTFVYDRGGSIVFRAFRCKQKERLSSRQLRDILVTSLPHDLTRVGVRPSSLVIHRDGRTYASELNGLERAVTELTHVGVLPSELVVGVVDIRKQTADSLRIFSGYQGTKQNPTVGTYCLISDTQGVIATTGHPFRFDGTAKPLTAVIVRGDLDIEHVLEDIFGLSQLAFSAPDKCSRLPISIKLDDDLLEPIASGMDEEEALYEIEGEPPSVGDRAGVVASAGGWR